MEDHTHRPSHAKTRSALTEAERQRLAKILARLESPFAGERAAAGFVVSAYMAEHGLRWSDLIGPQAAPASAARPIEAKLEAPIPPAHDRRRATAQTWKGYCRRRRTGAGQAFSYVT